MSLTKEVFLKNYFGKEGKVGGRKHTFNFYGTYSYFDYKSLLHSINEQFCLWSSDQTAASQKYNYFFIQIEKARQVCVLQVTHKSYGREKNKTCVFKYYLCITCEKVLCASLF